MGNGGIITSGPKSDVTIFLAASILFRQWHIM